MIVIGNAFPLLNLAIIGQLDLLRALYGEVIFDPPIGILV